MTNTFDLANEFMELIKCNGNKRYNTLHEGYAFGIMGYTPSVIESNGDFSMTIRIRLDINKLGSPIPTRISLNTITKLNAESNMSTDKIVKEITTSINAEIDKKINEMSELSKATNMFQDYLLK